MTKVFVYGTLKRGYRNNLLLESATFIGEGQTAAKCRLLHAGFPVLQWRGHRLAADTVPVRGEVYECDAETMRHLDNLESEGRMYDRKIKLIRLDSGKVIKAHVYVGISKYWRGRLQPEPTINGVYNWRPAA